MSINLLAIRWHLDHAGPLHKDECVAMCDEIDRLRKTVEDLHLEAERSAKTVCDSARELSRLRDRLRPRSIKDEPPPLNKWILAWPHPVGNIREDVWIMVRYQNQGQLDDTHLTHWTYPLPAPPAPDKFEEWAKAQPWWRGIGDQTRSYARMAWDSALNSVDYQP